MTVDNLRTELDEKNMELQLIKNMVKEMRIERQGQMERQVGEPQHRDSIQDGKCTDCRLHQNFPSKVAGTT